MWIVSRWLWKLMPPWNHFMKNKILVLNGHRFISVLIYFKLLANFTHCVKTWRVEEEKLILHTVSNFCKRWFYVCFSLALQRKANRYRKLTLDQAYKHLWPEILPLNSFHLKFNEFFCNLLHSFWCTNIKAQLKKFQPIWRCYRPKNICIVNSRKMIDMCMKITSKRKYFGRSLHAAFRLCEFFTKERRITRTRCWSSDYIIRWVYSDLQSKVLETLAFQHAFWILSAIAGAWKFVKMYQTLLFRVSQKFRRNVLSFLQNFDLSCIFLVKLKGASSIILSDAFKWRVNCCWYRTFPKEILRLLTNKETDRYQSR